MDAAISKFDQHTKEKEAGWPNLLPLVLERRPMMATYATANSIKP